MPAPKPKCVMPCDYCGIEIALDKSRVIKAINHYCSRECMYAWRKTTTMECAVCGVSFHVPPSWIGIRKCCSWECGVALRSTVRGEDHPSWKPRIERICENCDNVFLVRQCFKNARFCSQSCRSVWMQVNVHPITSSTENVVAEELDRRGLQYRHISKLGKFVPDFVVGQTVIEVDGDYWHTLPGIPERDAMKDAYYSERGFAVIRIWEHEVNAGDFSKLDVL